MCVCVIIYAWISDEITWFSPGRNCQAALFYYLLRSSVSQYLFFFFFRSKTLQRFLLVLPRLALPLSQSNFHSIWMFPSCATFSL